MIRASPCEITESGVAHTITACDYELGYGDSVLGYGSQHAVIASPYTRDIQPRQLLTAFEHSSAGSECDLRTRLETQSTQRRATRSDGHKCALLKLETPTQIEILKLRTPTCDSSKTFKTEVAVATVRHEVQVGSV